MFKLFVIAILLVTCQAAPSPDLAEYGAPDAQPAYEATDGAGGSEGGGDAAADESPKPFSYEYAVKDAESNNDFEAKQEQDTAGVVLGSYKIALSDGRIQTVTYTADPVEGFKAEVTFEGEAQYPTEPTSIAVEAKEASDGYGLPTYS